MSEILFRVEREWFTERSTIGRLYFQNNVMCFTLEDRIRKLQDEKGLFHPEWKVRAHTAIPAGRYKLLVNHSPKFNKLLPLVLNVPLFEGIRWHPGNTDHDTEGCLLLGETRGDDRIMGSVNAFDLVFPVVRAACGAGPVWVEYINIDPPEDLLK